MKTLLLTLSLLLLSACGQPFNDGMFRFGNRTNAAARAELNDFLGSKRCFTCHSVGQMENATVPGSPVSSLLYRRVADGSMPQGGPAFNADELKLLADYILALTDAPIPVPPPTSTPVPNPEAGPTYAEVKTQFLQMKCAGCHKGLADEATIPKAWLTKGSPETSLLYLEVANDSMPKWYEPLTSAELTLVHDYITDKGKPDAKVAYGDVFDQVLKPKCLKCHAGLAQEEGAARWVKPGLPDESRLYDAVVKGRMPKRIPKTTEEDKALLHRYIKSLQTP